MNTEIDGDLHVSSESLYKSRIEQDLSEIKSEKQRLEGEIQKYERLINTLRLLPNELSWELPHIALTKHALLPNATLVGTNEVTVHIGDNWFTRCSAHHAKKICLRRQEKCRETISALDQREKMLQSWQKAAGKGRIAGGQDDSLVEEGQEFCGVYEDQEIVEFVTEEEYLADKETHRKRVKEHYAKKRAVKEKLASQVSDEDLWQRLEELELEELTRGELRSTDRSERSAAPERELVPKVKKSVGFAVEPELKKDATEDSRTVKLGWSWGDDDSSSSDSSGNETRSKTDKKIESRPKKLSFAQHIETGSDETTIIEFSHTPVDSVPSSLSKELKSPSDIYSSFQEMFAAAASAPKSILKQSKSKCEEEWPTLSYPFSYIKGDLPSSDSDYEGEADLEKSPKVLGDVVEKIPSVQSARFVDAEPKESVPDIATEKSAYGKSVNFADSSPVPQPTNQKRGHKKISKFKSSRASSKEKN